MFGSDTSTEVKGNVVHQEALEFLLQPQDRSSGLHVGVQSAEYSLLLHVDVGHEA